MATQADLLRARAKRFAIRVVKFVRSLPRDPAADSVARQLTRAAASVSANYHSTGRSRSRAELIARLGVVVDEADESEQWLTVVRESKLATGQELDWLLAESGELRAIFSASLKTARRNHGRTNDR